MNFVHRIGCLFLLIWGAVGMQSGWSQTITLVNVQPYYIPGQDSIEISAGGIGANPSCDSISLFNGPGGPYSFVGGDLISSGANSLYLNLPNSVACGTYSLVYYDSVATSACAFIQASSASDTITVTIGDSVAFLPGIDTSYCLGDANPILSTLLTAGSNTGNLTFTANTTLPLLNPSTGEIYISSGVASPTPYQVIATSNSSCSVSDTVNILVQQYSQGYTYSYQNLINCSVGNDSAFVTPAVPDSLGTFSSTPGLVFHTGTANSGAIDLTQSTSGTYSVTYSPNPDLCFLDAVATVIVDTVDSAIFNYNSNYCAFTGHQAPMVSQIPPIEFPNTNSGLFTIDNGGSIDSLTGVIDTDILAPGTYIVTFSPNNACPDTTSDTFTLTASPNAAMSFPASQDTFCQSDAPLAPSVPNLGTFSQDSTFLSLNTGTGEITFATSRPGGPYNLYHSFTDLVTGCVGRDTVEVTILGINPGAVTYLEDDFCAGGPDAIPNFTSGALGGVFAADSSFVVINDTTGVIDVSATPPGAYMITYTQTIGSCTDIDTVFGPGGTPVVISEYIAPSIVLPPNICDNSGTPLAIGNNFPSDPDSLRYAIWFQGAPSAPGTILNDSLINTTALTPATYELYQFIQNGSCTDTGIVTFDVLPQLDASFRYLDTLYCSSDGNPIPFIDGDLGGVFSYDSTDGSLDLDDATGQITLALSGSGSFTVYYEHTGTCPAIDSFEIEIQGQSAAAFNYPGNEFCTSEDSIYVDSTVTPATLLSGNFTVTPSTGLDLDSIGTINPGTSVPNSYNITFAIAVGSDCEESFTVNLDILQAPTVTQFEYGDTLYCQDTINPTPITVSDTTGQYFSNRLDGNGVVLFVNDGQGTINLPFTQPGRYEVIFLATIDQCEQDARDTVTIAPVPDATFGYSSDFFCTSDPSPTPIDIVTTGGTFSGVDDLNNPLTGSLDPNTGLIDLTQFTDSTINNPYTVSYLATSSQGCRGTGSFQFDIGVGPDRDSIGIAIFPNGGIICEGDTVVVSAVGSFQFSFISDETTQGFLEPVDPDQVAFGIEYTTPDIVRETAVGIDASNGAGCRTRLLDTIQVFPTPTINFTRVPTTIGSGDLAELFMGGTVDSIFYNWDAVAQAGVAEFSPASGSYFAETPLVEGLIQSTVTLQDTNSPAEILFTVIPTTSSGCVGDTIFEVIAVNPRGIDIFIPEVFTPNFDGTNDVWQIQWAQDIDQNNYRIQVFNRAGGLVLNMDPIRSDWNGDSLPDGIYWWKMIDKRTNTMVESGGVTIIRKQLGN